MVYISGRTFDPSLSGHNLFESHDSGEAITISDTSTYTTSMIYTDVYSIAIDDFPPTKQGVQVKAADGTVGGLLTPFETESRYYRVRFLRQPNTGTVFRYGAIILPPS